MSRLIGAAMAALLFTVPAQASSVLLGLDPTPWVTDTATTITLSDAVPSGNQVQNLPCIICGANQPQQPALFGYNLFGNTGNANTVSFFSTATVGASLALDQFAGATGYSLLPGSPLLNALGGNLSFSVGLDVNDTSQAQTLESFWFLNLTTHTVLSVFSPGPGGTLVPDINNGTGFPDYTLSGLTLAGVNPGDQVIFFARITGANDGPDSFFIQPQVAAVPLPAVGTGFPMLIAGLGGLVALHRRRKQRLLQA